MSACSDKPQGLDAAALQSLAGGWVGAAVQHGHRLRNWRSGNLPPPVVQRQARVLIVGAGVAGLAAARALARAGISDVQLLELEDVPGGNARGHHLAGMACPLGAHYLPVPDPAAPAAAPVLELLAELGLARFELGRWVFDERHLCHSPQERLFFEGTWHEGLLPPAETGSNTQAQYRRFAALVAEAQRDIGFAMPSLNLRWTPAHSALESITFAAWLQRQGLDDTRLRWYLDYACRDDYGAGLETVSAWAGLHYFASRHGFHAPGDEDAAREPVLTWPEGNAWLTSRLAAPFSGQIHTGRTVLQASENRHAVELLVWDELTNQLEAWRAEQVILAVPLFIAAKLLVNPPAALQQAAAEASYAPWLVANLQIDAPLLQRIGFAPAWDNVAYGSASLGYVDAMHQSLRPHTGPTVLTAYWALPQRQRAALLMDDWRPWARSVIDDLSALHPDLPHKLGRIDLMRYGHAMRIPLPGTRSSAALQALGHLPGRVQLAHADLAGYSVFEEAYLAGLRCGTQMAV
ncbi:MAG: FAD-dependent oxidoreductase [Leptothrix sp. (in: b-proteobacteria)]